jgi:hypothetical protein
MWPRERLTGCRRRGLRNPGLKALVGAQHYRQPAVRPANPRHATAATLAAGTITPARWRAARALRRRECDARDDEPRAAPRVTLCATRAAALRLGKHADAKGERTLRVVRERGAREGREPRALVDLALLRLCLQDCIAAVLRELPQQPVG